MLSIDETTVDETGVDKLGYYPENKWIQNSLTP